MYKYVEVKNFRALGHLAIQGLARVNLFVGPNNCGKTSLLEALWLFHASSEPRFTLNVATFRGFSNPLMLPADVLWHPLFRNMNVAEPIEISARDSTKRLTRLTITLSRPPVEVVPTPTDRGELEATTGETGAPVGQVLEYRYQVGRGSSSVSTASRNPQGFQFRHSGVPGVDTVFLPGRRHINEAELAERFTNAEDSGLMPFVLDSLRAMEPNLESLSLGLVGGVPVIRGNVGLDRLLPLPLMGGGIVHVLDMLLAIPSVSGGSAMIDEIENGIYHKNLQAAWNAVDAASRRANVQIFATTHSLECVQAAIAAFLGARSADFRLHRLEREAGGLRAVTYTPETVDAAFDMELEVR